MAKQKGSQKGSDNHNVPGTKFDGKKSTHGIVNPAPSSLHPYSHGGHKKSGDK